MVEYGYVVGLSLLVGTLIGWNLRGFWNRLMLSVALINMAKTAERSCLLMLSRASEHYHHSLTMLKIAGEKTDKKNEIISTINSLEFTHTEWKKTAAQTIYNIHPFKSTVQWYDWRTAMQSVTEENLSRRK